MDADLKAELDAAADAAMREYQTEESRARALSLKAVLTDGVCRIVCVTDNLHLPCVGEISTDLGEKFPVFDIFTREQARSLTGKRVKLAIQMSARGTRYVTGMMLMPHDLSTYTWPCPRCCGVADRRGVHIEGYDRTMRVVYECAVCHYQMEVGS